MLAQRGKDLLPQEADARLGVFVTDSPIVRPYRHDRGTRLVQDALQLGDNRLGRSGDDLHIVDLLLEVRPSARTGGAPGRKLDESPPLRWREVA